MEKDTSLKRFFEDNQRFADIINAYCFGGEQLVHADDLMELDAGEGVWDVDLLDAAKPGGSLKKAQRYRDIVRKVAFGVNFAIIGIENQDAEDYSLPYRVMAYDVSRYGKQVAEVKRKVAKETKSLAEGEFLYKFRKDSRIMPVVTFVLYWGKEPYDGARDLHGIIDFDGMPDFFKELVQNYKIYLIDVRRDENVEKLITDVKVVFNLLRDSDDYKKWEKHVKHCPPLDEAAYDVVAVRTNSRQMKELKERYLEGGKVNMCKAWEDGMAKAQQLASEEARKEGRKEGRKETLVEFIKDGIISVADGAKRLDVSQEQMLAYMND